MNNDHLKSDASDIFQIHILLFNIEHGDFKGQEVQSFCYRLQLGGIGSLNSYYTMHFFQSSKIEQSSTFSLLWPQQQCEKMGKGTAQSLILNFLC